MKLSFPQKLQAALSAVKYRNEIKQLLVKRYWQTHKIWKVEIRGVTARFDTSDFFSNICFWQYNEGSEAVVLEILARLIKKSKVYADVGGHLGLFTVLPGLFNPDCAIFYFEGDRTIRPVFIKNIELNNLKEDRITIVNAVVKDYEGEIEYRPHPYSFLAMHAANENVDVYDLKCPAKVISLDNYFNRQGRDPDLVKIDVDGDEIFVLRGMSRILKESKPDLLLEMHPPLLPERGSSASEVCNILRELGYRFFLIPDFRDATSTKFKEVPDFNNPNPNYMVFVTCRDPYKPDSVLRDFVG
jgi:FkbM family methyltransferase